MDATPRSPDVGELLSRLFEAIDKEDFSTAHARLIELEKELGPDDPEITRARTLMSFLESEA